MRRVSRPLLADRVKESGVAFMRDEELQSVIAGERRVSKDAQPVDLRRIAKMRTSEALDHLQVLGVKKPHALLASLELAKRLYVERGAELRRGRDRLRLRGPGFLRPAHRARLRAAAARAVQPAEAGVHARRPQTRGVVVSGEKIPGDQLRLLIALGERATARPWDWFGNKKTHRLWLATVRGGRNIVMDFVRWGMDKAGPRFNVDGIMMRCETQGEADHNGDFTLTHPDALFITSAANTAVPLALEVQELRQTVRDMRYFAWFNHGCPFGSQYGDDGEMSCGHCGVDFKREPANQWVTHMQAMEARKRANEAAREGSKP